MQNISLFNCRYGYVTNTKIKFIIVLHSSNISLRDNDVKVVSFFQLFNIKFMIMIIYILQIFKKLHAAYSNAVCNPFYIPGDQLNSK